MKSRFRAMTLLVVAAALFLIVGAASDGDRWFAGEGDDQRRSAASR